MSRRPLIAGNIKMFLTVQAAQELFRGVWSGLKGREEAEIVYFPPFTALADARRLLKESPISWGGQNMHWETEGAFTGEISARMLLDLGCRYVLLGHSERRTYFGETDEQIHLKVRSALSCGLKAMVCVGETLEEREAGRTEEVLERQLKLGLGVIEPPPGEGVLIAYEPVWAIGTGRTATPLMAEEAHCFIRSEIAAMFGGRIAEELRILYGGSVKPDNAAALLSQSNIDGALVGGACLKPESFLKIIQAAS